MAKRTVSRPRRAGAGAAASGSQSPIRFNYDVVLKDLFQEDRPTLLQQIAGGAAVDQFLNVELASVKENIADLVLLLKGGEIQHIDFQSWNDPGMPYRVGIYGLLIARKYRRKIRQAVLYTGKAPMRMRSKIDAGTIKVEYDLIDIRQFDYEALLQSPNSGDYALALLARGGAEHLKEIIQAANRLPAHQRQRVFTQMAILAGLRGASERLTMEFNTMGISVEINENAFLKNIHDSAIAKGREIGREEGREEGRSEGAIHVLRGLLQDKFGPLPKWAAKRLDTATSSQAELWTHRILRAESLEEVIGGK